LCLGAELTCATTDGITSTDDSFPDEDFFPDISSLYIDPEKHRVLSVSRRL
jgi:hypothetical protein